MSPSTPSAAIEQGASIQNNASLDRCEPVLDGPMAELQAMLVLDCATQRRVAKTVQRLRCREQRAQFERALAQMESASSGRFWTAVVSAGIKVAAAVLRAYVGPAADAGANVAEQALEQGAELATQQVTEQMTMQAAASAGVLAAGCEAADLVNPMRIMAEDAERASRQSFERARTSAEQARDVDGWLASARDLERRTLERIEALVRSEHELHQKTIGG